MESSGLKGSGSSQSSNKRLGQELYDHQAATFDERAGLPAASCRDIARAVLRLALMSDGDLLVEIGTGTGQIGQWFESSVRYVGLDRSAGMLREFHGRFNDSGDRRVLIQADANACWPLASGAARAIFSSRAIHLLEDEHVAAEVFRVASPLGATLIIGRAEREPDSIRARMAREMNERLRRKGFEGRGDVRHKRRLFESLRRRGAEISEPLAVAHWKVKASPRASLDSWRSLKGLGGLSLSLAIREQVLTELEEWAHAEFGSLDAESESIETYTLLPLRVPPKEKKI